MIDDSDPQEKDMEELWGQLEQSASGGMIEWRSKGYVPTEELEVLADNWDESKYLADHVNDYREVYGYRRAAQELRELIEEHTND